MEGKTIYIKRCVARLIDLLAVGLVIRLLSLVFPGSSVPLVGVYLLYNIISITLSGETLGKHILLIEVKSRWNGFGRFWRLFLRELLVIPFIPLIALNALNTTPIPLHDLVTGTRVVHDETK